ncbi:MAG: Iron (metal) dependent repressor [Deltaproteobacteria bacterium]|nr:Iron (metal) dependent repressor [Deltaproteobacteria bacterium]MBS1244729.1 Iron (metal) dependent repressor [Deltaproteobacteria bacterium]
MTEHGQDEILELIWTLREDGKSGRGEVLRSTLESAPERLIDELLDVGMVEASGEEISLTKSGEERARGIIRRHRLAEVLLRNLFELDNVQLESSACQFEHILSEPVVESVCTFLGHPPSCPHGRPIPRGECCDRIRTEIRPLVMRLTDASLGATVRIVFITPRSRKRLEKLSSLGIVPGSRLRLLQRNPSFVLEIGQTTIAVDRDITDEIYIKPT